MSLMPSRKPESHRVQFGRNQIYFTLIYRERKTLQINVHPDKSVIVVAPEGKALEAVIKHVKKRAPWIMKQKRYFERFQPMPPARQFVSGETHLYLGKHYRLKVVSDSEESVKLKGRFIYVHTPDKDNQSQVKELLRGWYKEHAESIFVRHLEKCYEKIHLKDIGHPNLSIKWMKKRWGSCSKKGNINLNVELVKAPLHCIDYVITHELCHLKHPDHGDGFYRLLARCMPDWEKRKERLEQVVL